MSEFIEEELLEGGWPAAALQTKGLWPAHASPWSKALAQDADRAVAALCVELHAHPFP